MTEQTTDDIAGPSEPIISYDQTGIIFDWDKVRECARRPIRGPDRTKLGDFGVMSPEWRRYEQEYHLINACRLALIARHAGWIAATDRPDPMPPEPMMRQDDMKD
jgi:hypothetical protein